MYKQKNNSTELVDFFTKICDNKGNQKEKVIFYG